MSFDVITESKNVLDTIIQWRRELHQIPELGLELPQTVKYVTGVLKELGVEYDASYVDGNGIVAVIKGSKEENSTDKVLGLRADMDGLPIQEETGLPFSSTNSNMHACGHDGHTSMLLGAAKLLQENRHLFSGTVKLIFQPGEEYPGGAEPMIKEGAMNNPKVTRMLGFHAGQIDGTVPSGTIGYKRGPMMASMDRFLIEINGKGSHGAYPENSNDPIMAAGQIITALQSIKSRNIRAVDPAVVSITRVTGGFNQNIIPNTVELEGTVRALNEELQHKIVDRMREISTGIGAAMGVSVNFIYDYKYPPVINDNLVVEETIESLGDIFDEGTLLEIHEPLMGGEDYAFYLKEAPGTFLFLSNPGEIDGSFHGHHHPKFNIDESLLYMGTASFVKVALDYLN